MLRTFGPDLHSPYCLIKPRGINALVEMAWQNLSHPCAIVQAEEDRAAALSRGHGRSGRATKLFDTVKSILTMRLRRVVRQSSGCCESVVMRGLPRSANPRGRARSFNIVTA
jgi:hypothetical protein